MTNYEFMAEILERCYPHVSIEEKADFFAIFTNKSLDIDKIKWYNNYRKEKKGEIKNDY